MQGGKLGSCCNFELIVCRQPMELLSAIRGQPAHLHTSFASPEQLYLPPGVPMRVTTAQAAGPAASHASLSDVIESVASCIINLKELAILGACSKDFKQAVKQSVIQYHGPLLTEWVSESRHIDSWDKHARQQWSEGLRWCLKATDGFQNNAAGHVLTLPDVRLHVIEVMLENGFTFAYQQLVAAVKQRVDGVESWIHVMVAQGLELPTGMPQVAIEVTCSGCEKYKERGLQFVLEVMNPSNIADVLHLATNRTQNIHNCSYDAVEILEHLLQESSSEAHEALLKQMTPQLLQELMQTAVRRNYDAVFSTLLKFPAVAHLNTTAVQQMFRTAVERNEQQNLSYILNDLFSKLFTYLDATTTRDLLALAVKSRKEWAIGLFCKPNVAKLIGTEVVETWIRDLTAGLSRSWDALEAEAMLKEFCKFSAAHQVSSSCIFDCLAALIMWNRHDSTIKTIKDVTQLQPAELLTASSVQELLDTAVLYCNQAAAAVLLTLPASAQLSVDAFYRLLQQSMVLYDDTAMRRGEVQLLPVLLDMPAVASLSSSMTVDVIQHAVIRWQDDDELSQLLLPKLVTLDAAGILQLIEAITSNFKACCSENFNLDDDQLSEYHGMMYDSDAQWEIIQALLRTPAAKKISLQQAQRLVPLLLNNLGEYAHESVDVVCALPVIQQLTAEEMHQMLSLAFNGRCQSLAVSLLRLPAAETLPAASTQVLLVDAVMRGFSNAVQNLCCLPSARLVQLPVILDAVLLSMELRLEMAARRSLCDLLVQGIHCSSSSSSGGSSNTSSSSSNRRTGVEQPEQQWQDEADALLDAQQPFPAQTDTITSGQHHQLPLHQHSRHNEAAFQNCADLTAALNKVLDAAIKYRCLPAIKSWFSSASPSIASLFTSDRVVQLMEGATEQQSWRVLQLLCDLPAAADAPVQLAERMLLFTVQHRREALVQKLFELPMIQHIGIDAAKRLLWHAQISRYRSLVGLILDRIPAAMSMVVDDVIALMTMDLQLGDGSNVLHYLSVPAVQDFTTDQVMSLLKAAVAASHWSLVEALCREVPAAKALDPAAVEALLRHCIMSSREFVRKAKVTHGEEEAAVTKLCQLPGFQQLGAEAVSALRKAAASHRCKVVLAQLPAIQH